MKKVAMKAIPLVCAATAPFFISAEEQSEATAMVCAASMPNFSGKVATSPGTTTTNSSSSNKSAAMNSQMITPPAGPLVSNGADVFLTADFLWWKASADGLQYAYNGALSSSGFNSGDTASSGSMHQPHFKYEPGFKVGLGVLCNHDNWDLFAEYTWLNVPQSATKNTSSRESSTNALKGTIAYDATGATPNYGSAEAEWGLHFNVLDLELGRKFWISKRLALRPHAGMKFSWLKQEYDVTGYDLYVSGQPTANILTNEFELKQFGVGVRAGVDAAFYLWNKWSIFGDLAVTGMWNDFKSYRTDLFQTDASSDAVTNLNVEYHPFNVSGIIEMALGLRFETIFSKGRYEYFLQAAWENQVWFNQEQFVQLHNPNTPANLTLEGLTIKTGFYF